MVGDADESMEALGAVLALGFDERVAIGELVESLFVPDTDADMVDDEALETLGAELVDHTSDPLGLPLELWERGADGEASTD